MDPNEHRVIEARILAWKEDAAEVRKRLEAFAIENGWTLTIDDRPATEGDFSYPWAAAETNAR